MKVSPRFLVPAIACNVLLGIALVCCDTLQPVVAQEKKSYDPAALERARDTVKMLDDLYKTAVVNITIKYVEQQSDTPAAAVAKEIFTAMHKKGWHNARLVDATGKPRNKSNLPVTDYEKRRPRRLRPARRITRRLVKWTANPCFAPPPSFPQL